MSHKDNKFPFKDEVCNRFCRWLGIERNVDIDEAIEELTGDTYFEMRKLISQLLTEVESLIITDKYCGYVDGKELTDEQKESIKNVKEDLKEFVRDLVEGTWRTMLKKQKMGIDKLSIALKSHMNNDGVDMDKSSE